MLFILLLVPFLMFLFSLLVLFNAGRNAKEKFTIFLYNPEDTGQGSSTLITILRICFWISLFLSAWIIMGIIRHKG